MPIYAACPACGAKYPLEAAIADTEARRALATAVKGLPEEVLRRLVGYLGYHSPPGRAMSWPRTARVIDELVALINAGTVKRGQGAARAAPGWLWAIALDEIESMARDGTLVLPLSGHGLLEEICYRLAGKAEGKREAEAIARARGATPVALHPSHRLWAPEDGGDHVGEPLVGANSHGDAGDHEGRPSMKQLMDRALKRVSPQPDQETP